VVPLELTDGTITLRPWLLSDVPEVHRMVQDPEIPRFMGIPPGHTIEGVARFLGSRPEAWEADESWSFAVTDAKTRALLGSVALDRSLDDPNIGEIGYWMAVEARGRGVARAAVALISKWGFEACRLARIEITTHVDNVASQRVAEAAGFQREGILRSWRDHHGTRVDLVMYSRLLDD